jgi:3-phosphoshikimate 1-carboxyvinyltransferase
MDMRFEPARGLSGRCRAPADKSISHRAALLGAMASEPVRIERYLHAADTDSTLAAVAALGALVEVNDGQVRVRGTGLREARDGGGVIDVGNAGTLLRLLPGWLASQEGRSFTLDGDESIRRRPVQRIVTPLRQMGAELHAREDRYTPLRVDGAHLHGIDYELDVASAQVKSCILLAAIAADGTTTITEPALSRDHTERMLLRAGVSISRRGRTLTVGNTDEIALERITVPGDLSSAAFLIAAGVLVPGSRLLISDVGVNWTRTGFLRILRRMRGIVLGDLEQHSEEISGDEPVSDLDVAHGALEGTVVEPEEVPLAIDELPLVGLLGCFAEGETIVRGAQELRVKESDRIALVVKNLRAMGAAVTEFEDGLDVPGGQKLHGAVIDSGSDHRIAMAFSVAALKAEGQTLIQGAESAAISFPEFFDLLDLVAER